MRLGILADIHEEVERLRRAIDLLSRQAADRFVVLGDVFETGKQIKETVEWTWDGNDEMDPAQGRGWAVVKGDELHGMIFFHGGDGSQFVAKKKGGKKAKR
jgi:predicted phosphodiesterase